MSLEKIIERLDEEATLELKKIEQETQEKVCPILKEAKEKATSIEKEILKTASLEAQKRREHILTMAHLEARRIVLQEKERLIEEAYRKALVKLKQHGKESYQNIIKRMLLKVAKSGLGHRSGEVAGLEGEIIISKEDIKRITPSFIESINKDLKISQENRGISGGFILKQGKIEVNNSFESLLRSQREEIEPGLVKILFE